jgi:hypothetical protein
MNHWPWAQPTVIVLGTPGVVLGAARHPCLICTAPSPISEQGLSTFTEMRARGEAVLTLCYACHSGKISLERVLGSGLTVDTGTLRGYKGLDA